MSSPLQLKPEVMVFFGMRAQPFAAALNSANIYPTQNMQKLRDSIEEFLLTRNELAFLSGEPGIGTSTFVRYLLGNSSSSLAFFHVNGNPSLNSTEILLEICRDYQDQELLAAATRQGKSISKFASTHLFNLMKGSVTPIIVIDQAQTVSVRLINDIIRFCEAVNSRDKGLVKLMLVFSSKTMPPKNDFNGEWIKNGQFQEFILEGFKKGEAKKYLLHRMKSAGLSVKLPFTEKTIMVLAERSTGVPAKLDRLVAESLNSRVPTLVRAGGAVLSDEEKAAEKAKLKKEKLQSLYRTLIVLGLIALLALGVFLSL